MFTVLLLLYVMLDVFSVPVLLVLISWWSISRLSIRYALAVGALLDLVVWQLFDLQQKLYPSLGAPVMLRAFVFALAFLFLYSIYCRRGLPDGLLPLTGNWSRKLQAAFAILLLCVSGPLWEVHLLAQLMQRPQAVEIAIALLVALYCLPLWRVVVAGRGSLRTPAGGPAG